MLNDAGQQGGVVVDRQIIQALEMTAEVPILMYHSIDDAGPSELAPYRITPTAFESQVQYLADNGYHSISLGQWVDAIAGRQPLAGHPIIITFDDGYLNFQKNAWPLLERAGLTATMFVVTDKVGQTADWDAVTGEHLPLMSWDDLRCLRDRGLMIGSHTASHPSLPTLSTDDIVAEGKRSRDRLHQEVGIDATCIAFPYGHTDEALTLAGYVTAVGTWGGTSTLLHDPLNLPRIEIFPDDDLTAFAAKVARIRPRLTKSDPMQPATLSQRISIYAEQIPQGAHMPIHPDYAQRLAARLDTLVGDFVALQSEILTANGQSPSLQVKLTRLFRQPITGRVRKNLSAYEPIADGVCVGFEKEARVVLEVEPKTEHGLSPENCVNTLDFHFTGPSRWLTLECACEWADISSARRYQLGIYATVSHTILGRAILRIPGKDGKDCDQVFANFELARERRNLNKSGELPDFDFVNLNTDKRPALIIFLDTEKMSNFNLKLSYLNIYID
jgi:peptidoglycan/xylan/chitin deacetylase (PgdA/CDA1 family)